MNLHLKINKLSLIVLILILLLSFSGTVFTVKDNFIKTVYAADEEENATESKDDKQAPSESDCPECPECPDPAKVVLRGLEDKKKSITKESDNLNKRKKELERYEEQIDEKLAQLKKLKEQINSDLALLEKKKSEKELAQEAEFEKRLNSLVKTYAGMKPKNAAKIVDKMELEVARQIFSRMRESSAAQILANVDSEKAANITEHLAYKKK
jgi:flagellar motility protein MotE (MotC chaperone)